MVRSVHTVMVLLVAMLIGVAISACRDIDEPPPLPVFDPDAPLDGGPDVTTDGEMVRSFVQPYAQSIAC